MKEKTETKKEITIISNKSLKTITIVALSLIVILFVIQWICVYNNIEKAKQAQITLLKSKQEVTTFYFDYTKTKDKQILLEPKEFKKMYEHVNGLADIVIKESQRTQDVINQDIDRLNLYMSIGIGFISILGIFVPLLVNVLSFDDIKNKQKLLDEELLIIKNEIEANDKPIQQSIKKSEEAIEKAEMAIELTRKINVTTEKVDILEKSTAKVSTIVLQLAITRYLNVMPYLMTDFDQEKFNNLVDGMKNAFNDCEKDIQNSIIINKQLKTVIADFEYEINSSRTISLTSNPEIFEVHVNLSKVFSKHLKVTTIEEEIASNKTIQEALDKLKDTTNKYYAKTKSVA